MCEGNSYATLAQLNEGDAAAAYYGKALTAYCRGQSYAKLAQDDPAVIN